MSTVSSVQHHITASSGGASKGSSASHSAEAVELSLSARESRHTANSAAVREAEASEHAKLGRHLNVKA